MKVKQFILIMVLIIFAGIVFYIVCPKWEYIFILNEKEEITPIGYPQYPANTKISHFQYSIYRYNKIFNIIQMYNPTENKWFIPASFGDSAIFIETDKKKPESELDSAVWRYKYQSKFYNFEDNETKIAP